MTRLLVTGLGMAKSMGECFVCNFDGSWLINYPSTLLWSDKILVPESIWDSVIHKAFPQPQKLASGYKLVFEIAEANALLEVIKPKEVLPDNLSEMIFHQMTLDLVNIKNEFPEKISIPLNRPVDNNHHNIVIDGFEYCTPVLWTYYASLVLARVWNARCFFEPAAFNFFRYKFGELSTYRETNSSNTECFRNVYSMFLPNEYLFQGYAMTENEKCLLCQKEMSCSDKYLLEIENKVEQYLEWRTYDEVNQIKCIMEKIVKENENAIGYVDPRDVIYDFQNIQKKLRKRMRYHFPKIQRWINISTMVSIPLAAMGAVIQNPLLGYTNAGAAIIAKMSKELVSYLENKYKWVNFSFGKTFDLTKY